MAGRDLTVVMLYIMLLAASDERADDNLDLFKHIHEEHEEHLLAVEKAHEPSDFGRFISMGSKQ